MTRRITSSSTSKPVLESSQQPWLNLYELRATRAVVTRLFRTGYILLSTVPVSFHAKIGIVGVVGPTNQLAKM
jgi:hypothetical protein